MWVNEDGSVTFNQLAPPPANFTNKWEKASHTTAKVREADIDKKRKRAAGTKGGNKKAKGTPPSSPSTVDMPEPLRDALECYSAELVEKDLDASVPPSPKSLRLVADIAPKKTKALPTSAPWRKRKIQSHPDSDRSLNELLAMGFKWMPHNQGGVTASGAVRQQGIWGEHADHGPSAALLAATGGCCHSPRTSSSARASMRAACVLPTRSALPMPTRTQRCTRNARSTVRQSSYYLGVILTLHEIRKRCM